jgi:hypothetical protein
MFIEIEGAGVTIKVTEACRGSGSVDPSVLNHDTRRGFDSQQEITFFSHRPDDLRHPVAVLTNRHIRPFPMGTTTDHSPPS